jgi:glycosyltransferase involved in cell wall biosynthesis
MNSKQDPLVSVIIPSFNHQDYIGECIESVLNQSYSNLEILITDDKSDDQTANIVSKYDDDRITFTKNKKRIGQFATTNSLINEANGEYIAILNSDDVFLTDKIQKQVSFLSNNHDIPAVFCHIHPIDQNGKDFFDVSPERFNYKYLNPSNRSRYEWLRFFFYQQNCLCHPTVLIRKSCHNMIGTYNYYFKQIADFDLWVRLLMKSNIHVIEEPLLKFRIHQGNTSKDNNIEVKIRTAWEMYHVLCHFLSIQSKDDFNKIFPHINTENIKFQDISIPFLVAKAASEINYAPYKKFALDTIYGLLSSEKSATMLKDIHNFSPVEFMQLSGNIDTFNIAIITARDNEITIRDQTHNKITHEKDLVIEAMAKQIEQVTMHLKQTMDYRFKKQIRSLLTLLKRNKK